VNDRNLQRDIDRAAHADRLLNDELLNEALRVIRTEIISNWVATDTKQEKDREHFWMFAKTVDSFELLLKGYIETGKLSTERLKGFEERRGLRRVFG
jgi:hypothetical protein